MYLPKTGKEYYYLTLDEMTVKSVEKKKWEFDGFDITLYLMGNVFKGKKKAKENKDKVIENVKKIMREVTIWKSLS